MGKYQYIRQILPFYLNNATRASATDQKLQRSLLWLDDPIHVCEPPQLFFGGKNIKWGLFNWRRKKRISHFLLPELINMSWFFYQAAVLHRRKIRDVTKYGGILSFSFGQVLIVFSPSLTWGKCLFSSLTTYLLSSIICKKEHISHFQPSMICF